MEHVQRELPIVVSRHVHADLGVARYTALRGADDLRGEERRFAEDKSGDSPDRWYAAEALFLNNRPQEAIEVLRKGKNAAPVFEALAAQLRASSC